MNINRLTRRLCLLLSLFMLATSLPAQKRKAPRRKKSRTAVTAKPRTDIAVLHPDSLLGKAYAGKVGQTVVDFFGNRTTYGDVIHQIYLWRDSIAIVNQRGGDTETYRFLPYTLKQSTLTIGPYTYLTLKNGTALEMQKTTEDNEVRQGTLTAMDPSMLVNAIFLYGKHLDGMTIQTDEDKANALTCLNIAAEYGKPEARQYLYDYYKKRAGKGETAAVKYMMRYESAAANYAEAHKYCDILIEQHPQSLEWLCEKGCIYLKEGKTSDAKKLYKKLRKQHADFCKSSRHPFVTQMKETK